MGALAMPLVCSFSLRIRNLDGEKRSTSTGFPDEYNQGSGPINPSGRCTMSFFQRTEAIEPEDLEGLVGELVSSIRRSFTAVVVEHLEDVLAAPHRHMFLVDRNMRITEGEQSYTVDVLLFHVTQLRYIAIQVHTGCFAPALAARARYTLDLVDARVREPAVHAPSVGVLLCTDASSGQKPGPVAIMLYEGVAPAEQEELPLPVELTTVIDRCLARTSTESQP
jgi:hypothetical protein